MSLDKNELACIFEDKDRRDKLSENEWQEIADFIREKGKKRQRGRPATGKSEEKKKLSRIISLKCADLCRSGLSNEKAVQRLSITYNISESTVKKHISEARKNFILDDEYFGSKHLQKDPGWKRVFETPFNKDGD